MKATVIIPTTVSKTTETAIASVVKQTVDTLAYVVVDGVKKTIKPYHSNMEVCFLPFNVGANGFYGHRIYAAFTHLLPEDSEYVLFLDQDCWFEPNHVESCISKIEKDNLDWCYSLRRICDVSGGFICNDNCESLGRYRPMFDYHHVDTNCYCIKTSVAIQLAQVIHGGWGQDRVFYRALSHYFPNFDCTGKYTVNYRLAGNEGSVKREFFEQNNKLVNVFKDDEGLYPWNKKRI